MRRYHQDEEWRKLRELTAAEPSAVSTWMAGLKPPKYLKAETWPQAIEERTAGWRAFLARVRPDLAADRQPHGHLGYRATLDLGGPVHVLGLDSAWLCGGDDDAGRVAVTGGQELVDPDRRLRVLAAGSLFEGDHGDRWVNGFQLLTLHLMASGRPRRLVSEMWGWSRNGFWHPNGAVYKAAINGRLEWSWEDSRRARHDAEIDRKILDARGRQGGSPEVGQEIVALRRQKRAGPVLREGETLADRWVLDEPIGAGGWATVWRGHDRESGEMLAIKILKGELSLDKSKVERFERGARLMEELRDLDVVRVLDHGQDEGFHYVAMEYLPGGDLREAVLRGALDAERAIDLVIAVGRTLVAARERKAGLRHRDIKPANILLTTGLEARLTDFDLGAADASTGGTTGHLGTWLYAAPEQLNKASDADERADVYGLAMTAVFCMHGKDLLMDVIRDAPAFARKLDCDGRIREVVARGVAWEREARWGSLAAFCEALEGARRLGKPTLVEAGVGREEIVDERLGKVLVRIPAGRFLMGSPTEERERYDDEGPQHEVTITRDFWMGRCPVTNEQYGRFLMTNPGHPIPEYWGNSRFNQPHQPVVGVTWHDAAAFCRWMGGRLPMESEWEYACRAGTSTRFWSGDKEADFDRVGWCAASSDGSTKPVGEKPANTWGLCDMHGNVWEWCVDAYTNYTATSLALDPSEKPADAGAADRVVCGGSWRGSPRWSRSACRSGRHPDFRSDDQGFRVLVPRVPSRN